MVHSYTLNQAAPNRVSLPALNAHASLKLHSKTHLIDFVLIYKKSFVPTKHRTKSTIYTTVFLASPQTPHPTRRQFKQRTIALIKAANPGHRRACEVRLKDCFLWRRAISSLKKQGNWCCRARLKLKVRTSIMFLSLRRKHGRREHYKGKVSIISTTKTVEVFPASI